MSFDIKENKPTEATPTQKNKYSRIGETFGLATTLVGLLIFILGARPAVYGVDRSPIIGYVQISIFLIGLGIICLGGNTTLMALWGKRRKSILADFGSRLVATGYVIVVFSGMADVFGFGSHPLQRPYFGPWQAEGVMIGQVIIAVGLLMTIPFTAEQPKQ